MEAPNLERTSSLTWSGIGGLNWDRSGLLGGGVQQEQPRARTVSASIALPTSGSRLSGGFGGLDEARLPLSVDALLGDDAGPLVPPPSHLKRAVTFSGDFPHDGPDIADPLVATPPGLLGLNTSAPVFTRQRATSDAAAVRAAWGPRDVDPLAPSTDGPLSYSPAHTMLPRRAHSLSLDRTMWGPDSPRERSRTTHTLSVGSPDTEVFEMADPDDFGFSIREKDPSAGSLPRLGQSQFSVSSPMQHGMYASSNSLTNGSSSNRFPQTTTTSTTPQMHQQFPSASASSNVPRMPSSPFSSTFSAAGAGSPPAISSMSGSGAFSTAESLDESSLLEIQMQNLQVMQQQWMQMMQMQFDQTLYATQQRLQSMQVGGGAVPQNVPNMGGPNGPQQKLGRGYNGAVFEPGTGYTPSSSSHQQPFNNHGLQQHRQVPQPPTGVHGFHTMYPAHGSGNNAGNNSNGMPQHHQQQQQQQQQHVRNSPMAHKPHRRGGGGGGGGDQNNSTNAGSGGGQSAGPTSALLSEHKVTGRRLTASELVGHVVEFSRDSHGSRLVQYKMETGTPEERRAFVAEALPHALSLSRDIFGNYVVQNFFDNAAQDQRDMLASMFKGSIGILCTHQHGCRVVQRALFVINPAIRNDIIEELLEVSAGPARTEALVRSYSRDAHATHVLQKAVVSLQRAVGLQSSYKEEVPKEQEDPAGERERAQRLLEILENLVSTDCIPLSMHQQACRLVQRVLGACDSAKSSEAVKQLVDEVFANIDMLAVHQNGNFVLQHIIEAAEPGLAGRVQSYVCENAVRLARHKFGSHLVEKCLACATQPQANAIVEKFLLPLAPEMVPDAKEDYEASVADDTSLGLVPSILPVLMKDPYANFVVQKAFDVVRGELRTKLSLEIRARTVSLSRFSYGRHILSHINKAGALE